MGTCQVLPLNVVTKSTTGYQHLSETTQKNLIWDTLAD